MIIKSQNTIQMKFKKHIYLVTLFFGILKHLLLGQTAESPPDKFIPDLMKVQSVPGVAFAFIENGEIAEIKSIGYADYHTSEELRLTHSFNVGSISKTITAWGIMNLIEKGKLNFDDPISEFDLSCDIDIDSEIQSKITIGDLLQHTAGLSVHGYEGYTIKDDLPNLCKSIRGVAREEERVQVQFEPGSKFQYSGGGYTLLQIIIESTTTMKFADYMEQEIFTKLGMINTTFNINDEVLKHCANPHDSSYHSLPFEFFTAQAAAGLQTTLEDMTKFVLAHFVENDVISAKSISLLQEGSDQSKNNYGKGYMIMERFGSFTLHGHGGSNDGWQAGMMIDMENKSGFIMLTNGQNGKEVIFPTLMKWGMARRAAMKQDD